MSPDDPMAAPVVKPCMPPCSERLYAIIHERFLPSRQVKAWVWLDAPLRSVTDGVWWQAHLRREDTHAGERYAFETCPWCGGLLPEPKWSELGEGDGAE